MFARAARLFWYLVVHVCDNRFAIRDPRPYLEHALASAVDLRTDVRTDGRMVERIDCDIAMDYVRDELSFGFECGDLDVGRHKKCDCALSYIGTLNSSFHFY